MLALHLRSDEGLMLETSALETFHGEIQPLSTRLIKPNFCSRQQIVLPILLYEYKDQNLVQQLYMIFSLLPVEFSTIPGHFRQ